MSKIEKARELYAKFAGKTRLEIIDIFVKELKCARGTAASYHDTLKKAANAAPKSAAVKEVAAKAGKKVVDVKVPAKKRGSTGVFKEPLHNFTTAEMLEVMDDETRKMVKEVLNRKQDARSMHMTENGK